jgi:chaperonin GroEL
LYRAGVPLRTIVENAGLEGSVVVAKVAEGSGDFDTMPKQTSMLTCLQRVSLKKVTRSIRKRSFSCWNDIDY